MYKIIDNFLDKDFYEKVSNFIKSRDIPWFFIEQDTENSKNKNGYYCCCFYNHNRPDHSAYHDLILPILSKLNFVAPIQVRSNLYFRDKDTIEGGFHVDYDSLPHSTTAILFLTKCNAKVVLKVKEEEIFVDNIENRIVIFNSQIKHKVIYQTDVHKRHVINFNYFGKTICL
jgi:hypothetical protein